MTMYNLIEHSNNYSKTENLQQYFRDEPTVNGNDAMIEFNESNSTKSFNSKAKITSKMGNNGKKDSKTMVPLKYLSNFWSFHHYFH